MSLDWEAIGAIGEGISAVAVVVTLIFLTIQIRQNTRALRSNAWQAVQDAEQKFDEALMRDRSLADLWSRGASHGVNSLEDPAEKLQFLLIGKQLLDQFQTHHYHYQKGMIEEDIWQTWIESFKNDIETSPGFVDVVRERYRFLRPDFQVFVKKYVDGT